MRVLEGVLTGLLAIGTALAIPTTASAQGGAQRMQDRIHRADQQIQRLDRLQDRIRQMDQDMTREMDRIRDRLHAAAAQQMREQDRLHEHDQLRQHERLQDMTGALGQMTQQMRRAMQQVRSMEGDPSYDRDQVMRRQTEQLRVHLQKMSDDLEAGVRLMEQIRQRVAAGRS